MIVKAPIFIPDNENKYKFCGFPIGVSILPKFAATVCKTTTGIILLRRDDIERVNMANGTKVINATSLVISIDEKKHKKTRTASSCLEVWQRASNFSASHEKTPASW